MRNIILSILGLGVSVTTAHPQEQEPLWQYRAEGNIDYYNLTAFGTLLVSSDERTVALDPESGAIVWSSEMLRDCRTYKRKRGLIRLGPVMEVSDVCRVGDLDDYKLNLYSQLPMLILARPDRLVVYDLHVGKQLWDSDVVGFSIKEGGWRLESQLGLVLFWNKPKKKDSLQLTAIDLIEGTERWSAALPLTKDVEVVITRRVRGFWGKTHSGKKTLVAVRPEDGRILFESRELGKAFDHDKRKLLTADLYADLGSPEVDFDSQFGYALEVLYTDNKRLTAFDLETGNVKWRAKDIKVDEWVYDDGSIYALHDDRLRALNLEDGSVKWTSKTRAYSRMRLGSHGLVVGCDIFACNRKVELLDTATGQPVWTAAVDLAAPGKDVLWRDDHLLVALPHALVKLDLAVGRVTDLAGFEFEGNEVPETILEIESGLLLFSAQNVLGLDAGGRVRYQKHYRAPGLSTLAKVTRVIRSTTASALSYQQASMQASQMAKQNATLSALGGGSGVGRGFAFYRTYYPDLNDRFAATQSAADRLYIYTEDPDAAGQQGFSLVQFNPDDGREEGRAWVGQRKPKFRLDTVSGIVFLKPNGKTIEALNFRR